MMPEAKIHLSKSCIDFLAPKDLQLFRLVRVYTIITNYLYPVVQEFKGSWAILI